MALRFHSSRRPAESAENDGWAVLSRWPHWLAVLTAAATLLLICVGGLVTNTGSALAVPDWPTTFGYNMFLYPWSRMVGGIFYEHSHRLLGSAVGLLTVALAISLWLTAAGPRLRVLGVVALAAVIVQGVLGGLRVVLLEHGLAMIHGCVAQAFFALMVSLAVITSQRWQRAPLIEAPRLRRLALITVPLVYAQLVFGAVLTHTGSRLDAHLLGGAAATLAIAWLAIEVLRSHAGRVELHRPAALFAVLVAAQLSLGLGAYLWRFTTASVSIAPASGLALLAAHRVAGTALWGTAVLLALRIVRLTQGTRTVRLPVVPVARPFARRLGHGHSRQVAA